MDYLPDMDRLTEPQFRELIDHFFLPPQLPQTGDTDFHRHRTDLITVVTDAARAFSSGVLNDCGLEHTASIAWNQIRQMMDAMLASYCHGQLKSSTLAHALSEMAPGDLLALHIAEQNAGVIIRKPVISYFTVEHFEASFPASAVTQTKGKLAVRFPAAPRLSWPADYVHTGPLADLLADLDTTAMEDALPHTKKAGSTTVEVRDTADTRYIAELLGGIARALTDDVTATANSTVYVDKRVDDHVLWKNALRPWRRSPVWLVIRVAIQSHMRERGIDGRYGYKAFGAFLLARILNYPVTSKFPADLVYVMNVKLARRAWKLRELVDQFPENFPISVIAAQIKSTRKRLDADWEAVRSAQKVPLPWTAPTVSEIESSRHFTMENSASYIQQLQRRESELAKRPQEFDCAAFSRSLDKDLPPLPEGHNLPSLPNEYVGIDLAERVLAIEKWVAENVVPPSDTWGSSPGDLEVLKDAAQNHLRVALKLENPEQRSRMFLTVFELWTAVDRRAVGNIPLMGDYVPDVPLDLLHPLLLRTRSEMERLQQVEVYLTCRKTSAKAGTPSPIWDAVAEQRSFAVQFFDLTPELQALERSIQADADDAERAKLAEFEQVMSERSRLMNEASAIQCTQYTHTNRLGHTSMKHKAKKCPRCRLIKRADALSVQVFERPLPSEPKSRKKVTFELQVPKSFAIWRDLTYHVLCALDTDDRSTLSSDVKVQLSNYGPLKKYFKHAYQDHILSVASTVKSFHQSHYKLVSVSTGGDVIKNHPLELKPFDSQHSCLLRSGRPFSNIRALCHIPLPPSPSPYATLGWATCSTCHTANEVIAKQSDRHHALSIDEWQSFGHMRAGTRIQWRNILLQLVTGMMTFSNPAVHILVRQLAWQVEAGDSSARLLRQAHVDLADEVFAFKLIDALALRLRIIESNSQEVWTSSSLVLVACRLASVGSIDVQKSALLFLSRAREVIRRWLVRAVEAHEQKISQGIDQQIHDSNTLTDVKDASSPLEQSGMQCVADIAVTLRATYDLPVSLLAEVFDHAEEMATFLECGLWIDKCVSRSESSLAPRRLLIEHDQLLASFAAPLIFDRVLRDPKPVDIAVGRLWSGYIPVMKSEWRRVNRRWIMTETIGTPEDRSVAIHINVCCGTFYINGKASGTLPASITAHENFRSLFSDCQTLLTVPSTMKGMDYQSQREVGGLKIHFLATNGDVIIRTQGHQDGQVREFIHPSRLSGDVPQSILRNRAMWFSLRGQNQWTIEFRPYLSRWTPATNDWALHSSDTAVGMRRRGSSSEDVALDPRSATVQRAMAVFHRLEPSSINLLVFFRAAPLHVTSERTLKFAPENCELIISLPRYHLEFFVNQNCDLQSRDFTNMVLPINQEIGTLYGLANCLVLQIRQGFTAEGTRRKLLIPHLSSNTISLSRNTNGHANILVSPNPDMNEVEYFLYDVDIILRRLTGDGSLESRFYLTYLHALTSSHLSDPLIRTTGTEFALKMLRQGASLSFIRLTEEQICLLHKISRLTPRRQYYPAHLNTMQTEKWDRDISFMAQSDNFNNAVRSILDYDQTLDVFGPAPTQYPDISEGLSEALRQRAEFRTHQNFPVKDMLSCSLDQHVHSRGSGQDLDACRREYYAYEAMKIFQSPFRETLQLPSDLWKHFCKWSTIASSLEGSTDNVQIVLTQPIGQLFLRLLQRCQRLQRLQNTGKAMGQEFGLAVLLAIIAYRYDAEVRLSHVLLGIASDLIRFQADIPCASSGLYDLTYGHTVEPSDLERIIKTHLRPSVGQSNLNTSKTTIQSETYRNQSRLQVHALANDALASWPSAHIQLQGNSHKYDLINVDSAIRTIDTSLFAPRYPNYRLWEFVQGLQQKLSFARRKTDTKDHVPSPNHECCSLKTEPHTRTYRSWAHLLLRTSCPTYDRLFYTTGPVAPKLHKRQYSTDNLQTLHALVGRLPESGVAARYAQDLRQSIDSLTQVRVLSGATNKPTFFRGTAGMVTVIEQFLGPHSLSDHLLHAGGLWPRINPITVLDQLTLQNRSNLSAAWKRTLITYAEALLHIQRQHRLTRLKETPNDYLKEYENVGGMGWDALEHPDWLLVELDTNIAIRSIQAQIATHMMSPPGNDNAVMQLNMGEGKSSVIVPIIATSLADGQALLRVQVLKPLATQMLQILRQKISGLCDRPIYYLPFSRDMKTGAGVFDQIGKILKTCQSQGGVLLCQPEHVLSFKLMCMDKIQSDSTSVAGDVAVLVETQRWLEHHARDVLDESDELLHVRWQLIYTAGNPFTLEGYPERWTIIQEFLDAILEQLLGQPHRYSPEITVALSNNLGKVFPALHFMDSESGQTLICDTVLQILEKDSAHSLFIPQQYRLSAYKFVTSIHISSIEARYLAEACATAGNSAAFKTLLVLRGLVAHGILYFCLSQKRWRVDYGLDRHRSHMAVPYRAKDVPSLRADFGHPDCRLILTMLAHYYSGLSNEELRTTFQFLLKSDNPTLQYQLWASELPSDLRNLESLNLEDVQETQRRIFPCLRYNKPTIDFYLANCVFPVEAKEFPYKLTTNPWDLAAKKNCLTTGFSGTNDNKILLPLSITQINSDAQLHTNAEVLGYLLQQENRTVIDLDFGHLSDGAAQAILRRVIGLKPRVSVLLDVGAQVLDLYNDEVSMLWLGMDRSAEAAVFFDRQDQLCVIDRSGRVEPFTRSAFKGRMDQCVLYLDHEHTRGTDVKLPDGTRGAVTLGTKLTKDALVQGCMRLRNLGTTHSLVFLMHGEVGRALRALRDEDDPSRIIDSSDVLAWTIRETCLQIQTNLSLWASQGANFDCRQIGWEQYLSGKISRSEFVTILREREAFTLQELYGASGTIKDPVLIPTAGESQRRAIIREQCRSLGVTSTMRAAVHEEQERELAQEKEVERQVERAPLLPAMSHTVHPDVINLARTGSWSREKPKGKKSKAFVSLWDCLEHTDVPSPSLKSNFWTRNSAIVATADFKQTIQLPTVKNAAMNSFLRPVCWMLSGRKQANTVFVVLISPYEANELLPLVRNSPQVHLHQYCPRIMPNAQLPNPSHLDFCVVPATPFVPLPQNVLHELNLFAGALFLESFEQYETIRPMATAGLGTETATTFKKLLNIRRNGQAISLTHMGKILMGKQLYPRDFPETR